MASKRPSPATMDAVVKAVVGQLKERYARKGARPLIELAADRMEGAPVSTGCLALDLIMGGGVYWGRPVELFGEHSTGKSLVLMQIAREVQRLPTGVAVLGDVEKVYLKEYGAELGLDNEVMPHCTAKTVELVTEMLLDVVRQVLKARPDAAIMLLIDSLADMTTQHRLDEALDTADMSKAKLIHGMLAKLTAEFDTGTVGLVWSNQVRDAIQTGWVPPGMAARQRGRGKAHTTGGRGPGFAAHTRVELTRLTPIHEGHPPKRGEPDARVAVGEYIGAFAEKTRLTKPFGHCVMLHRFGKGLDKWYGLWDALARTGRLKPFGDGWRVAFGKDGLLDFDRKDFEALVDEQPEVLYG